MERMLELTGKKRQKKSGFYDRKTLENAVFSKINRGFSVTANTTFLAVLTIELNTLFKMAEDWPWSVFAFLLTSTSSNP